MDDAINAYYDTLYSEEQPERDPFVADLVRGTVEHLAEVDERITRHAEHWRMERMPAVDRNILRLAVYEMTRGGTPAAGDDRRSAGTGAQVLQRRIGAVRQWRAGRDPSRSADRSASREPFGLIAIEACDIPSATRV